MANYIDQHDAWTLERRKFVAKNLLQSSRSCYASVDKTVAQQGLKKAVDIFPEVTCNDRTLRKLLNSIMGIEKTEAVVHRIRTLLKGKK